MLWQWVVLHLKHYVYKVNLMSRGIHVHGSQAGQFTSCLPSPSEEGNFWGCNIRIVVFGCAAAFRIQMPWASLTDSVRQANLGCCTNQLSSALPSRPTPHQHSEVCPGEP